ncbi:hypothetical protein H6A07_05165 [Olsenella uli]|uniref:hypothetical protein n=1 Tax=Olsenella uli TaxID=133926 RepID=UPI00195B7B28|nr:hypothetical protein [Olsenella uli]MBM6676128.1 hypothetical protein [Olsenella uli]
MKWQPVVLALVLCLTTTACSAAPSEGTTPAASGEGSEASAATEEASVPEVDASWLTEDGAAMCPGVYVVGVDIASGNYIFSCPDEDDARANVTVFETKDSYSAYHQMSRFTVGEENEAIAAHSSLDEYLSAGESAALNLKEGNVLMVEDGVGHIVASEGTTSDKGGEVTGDPLMVVDGVYEGGSIQSGAYILVNTDDSGWNAVVFPNDAAYEAFENADHFTNGEWGAAVEKNAWSDFYLNEDGACYLNLDKDDVLMISGGSGVLVPVQMAWAL